MRKEQNIIRKLWELNTVRQRLRVAHRRIAIRSAGWDGEESETNNTLKEIAERILEAVEADKPTPDSPNKLLRRVDELRGLSERSTYRYLYENKSNRPETVKEWIQWAREEVEDVM